MEKLQKQKIIILFILNPSTINSLFLHLFSIRPRPRQERETATEERRLRVVQQLCAERLTGEPAGRLGYVPRTKEDERGRATSQEPSRPPLQPQRRQ